MRGRAGPGVLVTGWAGRQGRQRYVRRVVREHGGVKRLFVSHTVTGPCPCQANYFPITGPDALSPHCHHPHQHQHLPSVATALTSHPVPLPTPRASGEKDNLWDVVTRAEPSLSSPTKIFTISPRAHPRKGLSVVKRISCFPAFFLFCISSAKNNTK